MLKRENGVCILNPLDNSAFNCDSEERKTIAAIALAVQHKELEKIIVQSSYGARQAVSMGALDSFYESEETLTNLSAANCPVCSLFM